MKDVTSKILFPTDFQKQSLIAFEYAIYFANATNAEIVFLHVIEEGGLFSRVFGTQADKQKIEKAAQEMFDELCLRLKDDFKISTMLRYGKAHQVITEVSNEIRPQFIIIGKSEKPSLKTTLLGTNANYIVKGSKYPVITIRGENFITDYSTEDKNIVVPLDLTKPVRGQLSAAIEFGKLFHSSVQLVSVITKDSIGEELKVITRLNKAKKIVEEAGVTCGAELVKNTRDPIHKVVIDFAKKIDAHLIVVMTQSEQKMVDYFIGSTAEGIINNSHIPVLSILPWAEDEDSVFSYFVDPLGVFDTWSYNI